MNPPIYPFPPPDGSASLPLIEETEHTNMTRSGRLAPKWLEDVLTGELSDGAPAFLDVGCANLEERSATSSANGNSPRHDLLVIGHQTSAEGSAVRADGELCSKAYSCMCQTCRYHFTFYINPENDRESSCGLTNENHADPFHHLVFVSSEDEVPATINTKYYPFMGRSIYKCSAKRCDFNVCIEVSKPRLSKHFLDFLSDDARIANQQRLATENEPERFADLPPQQPNSALTYARIYLRDIVDGKKDRAADGSAVPRKIDQRNKKFYVNYGDGPDAAEFFRFLEFEEFTEGDSHFWRLPYPEITKRTRLGSRLAFFQDIKSEIETFISRDSPNIVPVVALDHLRGALDIGPYATSVNSYNDYSPADYNLLGIKPEMHESLFWYAFSCQRQTDPGKESAFFGALQRLTRGRGNEELEIKVQSYDSMRTAQPIESSINEEDEELLRAKQMSLAMANPTNTVPGDEDVNAIYNYMGLQNPGDRTDEAVLMKFQSLCASFDSQKTDYRQKLLRIARHTGSKVLLDRAKDGMDLEEARKYLGVQDDSDAEYIINISQYGVNTGEKDYLLVATALRTIGESRNDAVLLNAAAMVGAQRDMNYQLDGVPSVAMDLDDPSASAESINFNLPAGLQNIRNTCYLNSILQYLFTVKPVREIVLDQAQYGLEITDENLKNRRIDPGSTCLEEGEAFAGQQFAKELTSLFSELVDSRGSALKPPQRLALAALKGPKQLEEDGAKILASSATNNVEQTSRQDSPAPPLPARHAPPPPVPPRRSPHAATRVQVNAVSEFDGTDSASTRSSQTLVNQADDGWQAVSEVEEGPADPTTHGLPTSAAAITETAGLPPPPPYAAVAHPQQVEADTSGDSKICDSSMPSKDGRVGEVNIVFDPPPTQPISEPTVVAPVASEPTVEEKISRALNDSSVSGTDQQDVEEVMGNVISHLRAAVKATGEDEETGLQRDPVTDTFFWTSISYNRSNNHKDYNRTVTTNRWVTAYPDEGGRIIRLLQALDNSFQREFITEGKTRYERFTSILKLPPILHVHIQRTTRDGGKNNTAIQIPEVLYLDRFMDSPEGSELFERRRRAWNLQERLRSLKGPNGESPHITFASDALRKAAAYTNMLVDGYIKNGPSDDGKSDSGKPQTGNQDADMEDATITDPENSESEDEDDSDYFIVNRSIKTLMDENGISLKGSDVEVSEEQLQDVDMTGIGDASKGGINAQSNASQAQNKTDDSTDPTKGVPDMTKTEIEDAWLSDAVIAGNELLSSREDQAWQLQSELDSKFADLKEHEYYLHAVICHAGQTGKSGHYWVWVYDFEKRLWRRYNDSVVTEEPDSAKVMQQLSTQGEPYYLAYVRAEDVAKMVSIPQRTAAVEAEEQERELAVAAAAKAEAEAEAAATEAAVAVAVQAEAEEAERREAEKVAALEAAAQSRRLAALDDTDDVPPPLPSPPPPLPFAIVSNKSGSEAQHVDLMRELKQKQSAKKVEEAGLEEDLIQFDDPDKMDYDRPQVDGTAASSDDDKALGLTPTKSASTASGPAEQDQAGAGVVSSSSFAASGGTVQVQKQPPHRSTWME